ncbi:MAG: hypothetical protein KDB14_26605 [Planctomycetales bacterium]|nr:hypothetical protein [Planctomycetales bacterium]
MTIQLARWELRHVEVQTRMPFRYGIATLTRVPYLLVYADFLIDGMLVEGVAADVLPPKWFTKRPEMPLESEIREMLRVIRSAAAHAESLSAQPTVYRWWRELYELQQSDMSLVDASGEALPPLLTGFGVSLFERAAVDAMCRANATTWAISLRSGLLGLDLGEIHPALRDATPDQLLPTPTRRMHVRHTIGLADPLTLGDVPAGETLDDALPQTLEQSVSAYQLTHFKIKLPSDPAEAVDRTLRVLSVAEQASGKPPRFTLDGNEAFATAAQFIDMWRDCLSNSRFAAALQRGLIAVEQPLHRDVALCEATRDELRTWADAPPLIIDESDAELTSLPIALDRGYVGTSHKNCKGVLKGIANGCLLEWRRRQPASGDRPPLLTGEDLMNLGPVALQQDLAVAATLGLQHVERNGHHFVTGLRHLPPETQQDVMEHHDDLYRWSTADPPFPSLAIDGGQIALDSVLASPFGYRCPLPREAFAPVDDAV